MLARIADLFSRQRVANHHQAISQSKRSLTSAPFSLAFAAALWSVTASGALPQVPPSIAVNIGSISISGLTPGASAIVFSISREKRGYATGYVRHDYLLRPANVLGNAGVTVSSVSPISVWCVVDLRTGAYATATPSGYALRQIPFPNDSLRAVGNVQLNRLRLKHDFLEILWVRPAVGAWLASVGDGGESDSDHTVDGHLSVGPEQMEPLGSSPPPPNHFLPDDTFILVDPDTMEFFAIQVGR